MLVLPVLAARVICYVLVLRVLAALVICYVLVMMVLAARAICYVLMLTVLGVFIDNALPTLLGHQSGGGSGGVGVEAVHGAKWVFIIPACGCGGME